MAKERAQTKAAKLVQRKRTGRRSGSRRPRCRIVVLGVGGAGNRIVSRLVGNGVTNAECVAVNTDLKDLGSVDSVRKVLIGEKVSCGFSAGGNPETGRAAAQESAAIIESLFENVDVGFVVVGLGGGTGTGAAPIVAEIARRKGAVVVGVVATPFKMEEYRTGFVTEALSHMRMSCDTVVLVDNGAILKAAPQLRLSEAQELADSVLTDTIKGIVETLSEPSMVNLDFGGFKTVVREGGMAVVGVGESDAPNRAEEAVENAWKGPLLDADFADAKGALIHISGDPDMTVQEVDRVRALVTERVGRDARIVWGAQTNLGSTGLQVTLVMTGIDSFYKRYGVGNVMPELFDIESSYDEPERALAVDLGLDQIEDSEE